MPLHNLNYENFFLGNATELWIASHIYLNGFEANKISPDFGIDLMVTNAARSKFKDEELTTRFLQIKSAFFIKDQAKIYLDSEEFEFLTSRNDLSTVFCLLNPLIEGHPQSFNRGDFEPWRESLEAQLDQMTYDDHFNTKKKSDGCLSALDFKGFFMEYFWMNSSQLKKSADEFFWSDVIIDSKPLKVLTIKKMDQDLQLVKSTGESNLVREVRNIYYWLNHNESSAKLTDGAFLFDHY